MEYLVLCLHSFAAATLLPIGSEPTLLLLLEDGYTPSLLLFTATLGNTSGAVVNWWLGRYLLRYQGRSWFPFTEAVICRAQERFARSGVWVLLFAWLPIVGDPLTLIGGAMRVNLVVFIMLVGLGKCLRYLAFVLPYWV
ncbi:MAG: hypothetical protein COA99_10770 [Moraxellaceae bacterium]|nr:MAG: hypothetical protein COA99_10770 [Moraxellaceae bacterium]